MHVVFFCLLSEKSSVWLLYFFNFWITKDRACKVWLPHRPKANATSAAPITTNALRAVPTSQITKMEMSDRYKNSEFALLIVELLWLSNQGQNKDVYRPWASFSDLGRARWVTFSENWGQTFVVFLFLFKNLEALEKRHTDNAHCEIVPVDVTFKYLRDQLGKRFEEFAVMKLDSKQLLDLKV